MKIVKWMREPVHSVKPLDSILHARKIMEERRVNQLPVVVDGRVVGIVTDRDVRDAFPSVFDARGFGGKSKGKPAADPGTIPIESVMSANVLTLGPDDSVARAATLMRQERIGAVPIVANGHLAGILTRSDILGAFLAMTEAAEQKERP